MALRILLRSPVRFVLAWLASICVLHVIASASAAEPDRVLLSETTVAWRTLKYATDAEGGFAAGSLDAKTTIERRFKAHVLENRYLKVTLLPEFGGRILSIIYKPTGHEELYRSELGVPYGMGGGAFYYDWMMVYGGIFPTFPDPEHGKTWLRPWDFKVVRQSEGEVTVAMSIRDDIAFPSAPKRFSRGMSGIEATYLVTLKAGRAALDARLVLKNPQNEVLRYEYWTCTTLAPGSDPGHPRATAGAEIVAPVAAYATPTWSANIAEADASAGPGTHRFEKLRSFRNWPSMGIAYAAPDMAGGHFWGVINHDNDEGIIRIADNSVTRGLKMWTWGFPTVANEADPRKAPSPGQPYVELWGGVSDQFFHSAQFPARGEIAIAETYSPTVGMRDVTHANENILINLVAEGARVDLQFVSIEPDALLHVTLKRGGAALFDGEVKADPERGNRLSAVIPGGGDGPVRLTIGTAEGQELISAEVEPK